MPETKGSYAWDQSKASLPKPRSPKGTSKLSLTSGRKKSAGRKSSDTRRKSSGRRKSSRRSRRSKERRRSSRGSRKSRDRRRSSRRSSGRRKSSRRSRKSKDGRKSESPRRESSRKMTNPPDAPPKKSISKVKVWQIDGKFPKRNSNKKSWQAVPPAAADTNGQIKNRKSKASENQGMMEQQRKLTPIINTKFNTIEEEEDDEDSDSDDPLNLPKDPEIYMYQQLPLEPEVKKFRPGCSCSAAGRLSCWCKLLSYLEIFIGINLVIFKITVICTHPARQQVREAGGTVDAVELAAYSVITIGGFILLMGAGCRLRIFCLLHVIMVLLGMLILTATIVLYIVYKAPIKSKESVLDGVWWFLVIVKIAWLWILLWSALLSLLLFLRIRQTDRMNLVKPMEFTVSPQTYMSKVEIFLNV